MNGKGEKLTNLYTPKQGIGWQVDSYCVVVVPSINVICALDFIDLIALYIACSGNVLHPSLLSSKNDVRSLQGS